MRDTFFWVAMIALVVAAVSGVLGFVVYPATTKGRGHKKRKAPPPKQGLARSIFIISAAAALMCLFFGLFLPG